MKTSRVILILLPLLLAALVFSCKKDKCEDQYCINGYCDDGTCICSSGYSGEHCETKVDGYSCVSGTCYYVSSGAQYSSSSDCQLNCSSPNTSGYNCVSGNCSYVSSGAQYSNLSNCQNACTTVQSGYNCVSGNCSYVSSGAQYSSLSACQNACTTVQSGYNCVSGNCGYVSSGAQYSTLSACQNACTTVQSGYNCVSGNCGYVSSGAQYSSLSACQNACTSSSSTITFVNMAFTPISVTFNGTTKTAPTAGTAVFTGTPGVYGNGTAQTSGMSSQGTQLGVLISWNDLYTQFPSSGNQNVNLNVSSSFFFLKLRNDGTTGLSPVYVNYGLQSEEVNNVVIPNNNQIYNIGYFNAWSNSNVRAYRQNSSTQYIYWNQGSDFFLPFTQNQSITLVNTN